RRGARQGGRGRATPLPAPRGIGAAGLLPAADADELIAQYRYLRRVSTALRMFGARPPDALEPAGPVAGRVARGLDYPSRKAFLEDYRRRTSWVRALYDRVVPAR